MRSVIERIAIGAVLGGVLGALPLSSVGAETAAVVLSATGSSFAESATDRRSLECQGVVADGERIVTDETSRAGLQAGDLYVQLDPSSSVAIGRTEAGAPSIEVISGRVRLVDTGAGAGPAFEIRTPDSRATGRGNDTEVTVSNQGTEFCEAAADLDVALREGDGSLVARPGQCVAARAGEPLTTAPGGGSQIALSGAEGCIEVAAVDHFLPDVAAPPPTIGLAPLDPPRQIWRPRDSRANPSLVRRSRPSGNGGGDPGFGGGTGPAGGGETPQ